MDKNKPGGIELRRFRAQATALLKGEEQQKSEQTTPSMKRPVRLCRQATSLTGPASSGRSVCAPVAMAFSLYRGPPWTGVPGFSFPGDTVMKASFFKRWFGKRHGTIDNKRGTRATRLRPILEQLEDRTLPSGLTLAMTDSGGTYNGQPFPATVSQTGPASLQGQTPTLTYYAGSTATGTPLAGAPVTTGTYTAVASLPNNLLTLNNFSSLNSLGYSPAGGLLEDSSGNLFGTNQSGGANNAGTLFEWVQSTGAVVTLADFGGDSTLGSSPSGGLVMDARGDIFGTTSGGGIGGDGTVFEWVKSTGTLVTLASFDGSNGSSPYGGVVRDASGNLFGTTFSGTGANLYGTLFEWIQSSGNLVTLAAFSGSHSGYSLGNGLNAGLVQDSIGDLFGVTDTATSASVYGGLFEWSSAGGLVIISSFNPVGNGSGGTTDGYAPLGGLVEDSSGNLFGTTALGGTNNNGTVFEWNASTQTRVILASFDLSHGSIPTGGLIEDSSGNLFGVTTSGGANGNGTVFEMAHGSNTIADLASFDGSNGQQPEANLVEDSSGNVFGTTQGDSVTGGGTLFEIVSSAQTTFTIGRAAPTVTVSDAGGTYDGSDFPATATVAGVVTSGPNQDNTSAASLEGVTPTLTYYAGTSATGTPLSGAPSLPGTYTALASFAGSTDYTSTQATATFTIRAATPVITEPANQTPSGTNTTQLQVRATDPQGSNLSYAWSVTSQPTGATTTIQNANSNNASVTFSQAGTYTFTVTVTDALGLSSTSGPVTVFVTPTGILAAIVVTPSSVEVANGATQQFTAGGEDRFGNRLPLPPNVTWQLTDPTVGTISSTGLFTASGQGNSMVVASVDGLSGPASVTVVQGFPPVITVANQTPSGTSTTQLQVRATDPQGSNLSYAWSVTSQPTGATTTIQNANSNNASVTFSQAGTYTFTVTVTDSLGLSSTSGPVTVFVTPTGILTAIQVAPSSVEVAYGATQQYTAIGVDRFGNPLQLPPNVIWQVTNPFVGTISSTGLFTASGEGNTMVLASFDGVRGPASVTITRAKPALTLTDAGGAYNGSAFPATATVAGVVTSGPNQDNTPSASLEGVTPTLTYYAGATATGTPLSGPPSSPGVYTVVASFAGSTDYASASASATFTISATTTFTGFPSVTTITYGTLSTTISGHLSSNGPSVPPGETVTVTLNGVSQNAVLNTADGFSATFSTGTLSVAGSPYTINFAYAGNADYTGATGSSTLTVQKATPVLTVSDGGTYNGMPFAATATVAGVVTSGPNQDNTPAASLEGVAPALTYYDSTGQPLTGAPTAVGVYTVFVSFPGSADYLATSSFRTLANFNASDVPNGNLVVDSSGNLFGTTQNGGAYDDGTLFEWVKSTATLVTLVSFNGSNGAIPNAPLVVDSSGDLFGTTYGTTLGFVGPGGVGTLFEWVKSSGTLVTLLNFGGASGANPDAGLIADSSGNLFGTTEFGGDGSGSVFEWVKTSGTLVTLASFNGSNGADPNGPLVEDSSGDLFGTTYGGPDITSSGVTTSNKSGTVFEWIKSSQSIVTLAAFDSTWYYPIGGLVEDSSGNLFGTANKGGVFGNFFNDTLFEWVKSSGSLVTLATLGGVYDISFATPGSTTFNINISPYGLLADSSGNLFSATSGTIVEWLKSDGTLVTISDNAGTVDGSLVADSSGNLFGTTLGGTLFELANLHSTFTISKARPTVTVTDAGGNYNGSAFPATATVAGVVTSGPNQDNTPAASLEHVTPTLTYYAGTTATGTPLSAPPSLPGVYTVLASFAGSADYTSASATATFTIRTSTSFSDLNASAITYGTASTTIFGELFPSASGQSVPAGETVTITINGVTQSAALGSNSQFSATFSTSTLKVAGSPYTIAFAYAGDAVFASATASSTLTVDPASPTLTVSDAGGPYNGSPVPATATIAGVVTSGPNQDNAPGSSLEGVTPTLTYYAGSSATGTPLPGAPTQAGIYTVVAYFPGSADYIPTSFSTLSSVASFDVLIGGGAGGIAPTSGVVEDSGGNLLGTTSEGGANFSGTIFGLLGSNHRLVTLANFANSGIATIGIFPTGPIMEDSSGNLFGTTSGGGTSDGGTIFEWERNGGALVTLADFNSSSGFIPTGGLVDDSSGNLFGTTYRGGVGGTDVGTLFEWLKSSGTLLTLATFDGSNGAFPTGNLIADSNGNLFGTTSAGGLGAGTLFEWVKSTGTLVTLGNFDGSNGALPVGGLFEDGSGNLFGTTVFGGANNRGTVFEWVNSTNTLVTLGSFDFANGTGPESGLVEDGSGDLFGTTFAGGSNNEGTLFEWVKSTGSIVAVANFDGANGAYGPYPLAGPFVQFGPSGNLLEDSFGNLLGTTFLGGAGNAGTIFELPTARATFAISGATPKLTVSDPGGTYNGFPFPAIATVAGVVTSGPNQDNSPAGSLEGVTPTLTYYAGSTATGTPLAGAPVHAGTYTVVASFAGSTDYAATTSQPTTFTIGKATPALTVSAAGGAYNGSAFAATATVAGVVNSGPNQDNIPSPSLEGVAPTLTYYSGTGAIGTPLAGAPTLPGTYTVFASFPGSTDYVATTQSSGNLSSNSLAFNGANGANPLAGLVEDSSGNFFGTTSAGGDLGYGTIFEWVKSTNSLITLVSLNGVDGAKPTAGLIEDASGNLYGTTSAGGDFGHGTVFEWVQSTRTHIVLANLGSFGGLVADSGGNLFFTTAQGGIDGIFEWVKSTRTLLNLASFNGTNGFEPLAGLTIDSSGDLFGTTSFGGANGEGTVFEWVKGTGTLVTLANFNGGAPGTSDRGSTPAAGLVEDANGNLFGTTEYSGVFGYGTIFEWQRSSGNLVTLASFDSIVVGAYPVAGLVEDANGNLFGTASAGGIGTTIGGNRSGGTVFEWVKSSGTLLPLFKFTPQNQVTGPGYGPMGGLVEDSSGNLFGTTERGGPNGDGTVFGVNAPPQATFTISSVTLQTPGETLSAPTYTPLSSLPHLPAGATAALQYVTDFTVTQVTPGGSATVVIQLPAGTLQPNTAYAYFKYNLNNPGWVRVNPGVATFNVIQQTITLNLKDDGVVADGDEDAADSGDILDPGLPVALATPTVNVVDSGGTYNGSPFAAMPTVAGVDGVFHPTLENVAPTLDYQQLGAGGQVIADLGSQAPASAGSYQVIATFPGSMDYITASATTPFTIAQATPQITWQSPSTIAFFTPLGANQLDAAANVPGTFVYAPPAGTLLPAGTQTLSTTFTPADRIDYTTATASVTMVVLGPGVTVIGNQLYIVGGQTSNDYVQLSAAGASNTGSTGIKVNSRLNGVSTQTTLAQSFTAIDIFLGSGNDIVQQQSSLTIQTLVAAGGGNDLIQLGNGNRDSVTATGNGNDVIQLGNGNSDSVTVTGNGNNLILLGNGNNDTVTVTGNGNDLILFGTGSGDTVKRQRNRTC
jgi:uncharacterized repeat protein (TIGR03803 family)